MATYSITQVYLVRADDPHAAMATLQAAQERGGTQPRVRDGAHRNSPVRLSLIPQGTDLNSSVRVPVRRPHHDVVPNLSGGWRAVNAPVSHRANRCPAVGRFREQVWGDSHEHHHRS